MNVPTPAQKFVSDSLYNAKYWHTKFTTRALSDPERINAATYFGCQLVEAALLEHLRRVAPDVADRLVPWLLAADGIFGDDRAAELLDDWLKQLAAGEPMHPIGPEDTP